jgi:N-acetylmuramoyl-L-alanine amidase
MPDICISSGHGLKIRGAKGVLDEVNEARRVVDRVAALLRTAGVGVTVFHENTATSVSANLNNIVAAHNRAKRDRDVSVHFNAFKTTSNPMGTECLHKTQQALAAKVSKAMANAGRFIDRGAKRRTDLSVLNRFAKPALLLEVCFVDSSADAALYQQNFEAICRGIAESIADVKLPGQPPPVEPPAPPPEPPAPPTEPELTGDNIADVSIEVSGDVLVTVNNDPLNDGSPKNRLDLSVAHAGDVLVTINGEDFQIAKPPPVLRPTLRVGSRGEQVRVLQDALGARPVDGIFGAGTERAVRSFQSDNGLTDDGVVGPSTWTALERVFDLPPYAPPTDDGKWYTDIVCTVFGGSKDPNKSAYPPYGNLTDSMVGASLPSHFPDGDRPRVRVRNRANGREVVCTIDDIGPWNGARQGRGEEMGANGSPLNDAYWLSDSRPQAESGTDKRGRRTNKAGIDLLPAAAKAIGLNGKGVVDWRFEIMGREEVA